MIALLATLAFSAFPPRGSLMQTLDSAFVLDKDTVRIQYEPCTCTCPSGSWRLYFSKDSSTGVQGFPGTAYLGGVPVFAKVTGNYLGLDASGRFPRCSTETTIPPSDSRRFLQRGSSGVWAVWADSVFPWTSTTRTYETIDGVLYTSIHQKETFKARWRWSRIDTAVPWARWVDTIRLVDGAIPIGLPVLTTIDTATLGYLAPQSAMADLGLVLRDRTDTANPLDWGYRNRFLPVSATLPAGRTFRVLDAFNPHGGTIRWDLGANGRSRDELKVVGQATTEVSPLHRSGSIRWATVAREVSTGRRFRLATSLPPGPRILAGPDGIRMVVVE